MVNGYWNWILAIDIAYWLLALGYRLLAIVDWLLVIGYDLLAIDYRLVAIG